MNQEHKEQLITTIVQWIKDGKSKHDVRIRIMESDPDNIAAYDDAEELIALGIKRLEAEVMQDPIVVVTEHLKTYDLIHAYYQKIKYTAGMNKALKAKERLKGLLKKSNIMINQSQNITIEKQQVRYDVNRLTPAEQKRFTELREKIYGGK